MAPRLQASVLLLLITTSPAIALLDAMSPFRVNTHTAGDQRGGPVAVHNDGSFVVAWASGATGRGDTQDGSGFGVFMQRFDAAGAPVGGEQRVNVSTAGEQHSPAVAARGDGSFVVVWMSGCWYWQDCPSPGRWDVMFRRYDAAGVPAAGEQIVGTVVLLDDDRGPDRPAVAVSPTGDFAVAWSDWVQVYVQRFDAAGMPEGGQLSVAPREAGGHQSNPAVAVDPAGNYVVLWREFPGTGVAPGVVIPLRLVGRRYDPNGVALGDFEVADGMEVHEEINPPSYVPAVATFPDGGFVAAWTARYYQRAWSSEILSRRFAGDGTPLGPAVRANDFAPGFKAAPKVAACAAHGFVVVWTNGWWGPPQDGTGGGVFAQAFAPDGAPDGGEFQVNEHTAGQQSLDGVGGGPAGSFVLAWTSDPGHPGNPGEDGNRAGVFARQLALRPCTDAATCSDASPCTFDDCEGGFCTNRRQRGCCQFDAECDDADACTQDTCPDGTCVHAPIPECIPCGDEWTCPEPPGRCVHRACSDPYLGRCTVAETFPGCCTDDAECNDASSCTDDVCDPDGRCMSTPVAACGACVDDAECRRGCLLAPETCTAGRCETPAGCPHVAIAAGDPSLADGLLVRVTVPADAPAKAKLKAAVTATVAASGVGAASSRRCRAGKRLGRTRAVLQAGAETTLRLILSKPGARCLLAGGGELASDVTVQVRHGKTPLSEMGETRVWRQ